MRAEQFWDDIFSRGDSFSYSRVALPPPEDPVYPALEAAMEHFGDVAGKTILDVGCGKGSTSLFFAERGARVVCIDLSRNAVGNLRRHCEENGIEGVEPHCMRAQDIAQLGPVDFVFGSMILHHIEPFGEFAATLRSVLAPGGKGLFFENNAASSLMIWFRQNMVGKYGIPKFGDDEEFPLTPAEIGMLRRHFDVRVVYPEMYMARMVSTYLLKGRMEGALVKLDELMYRVPALRRYSYRQLVYLS